MKKIFQKFENKNEDKNLSFNASFVGKTFACGAHTVVVEDILAEGEVTIIENQNNNLNQYFIDRWIRNSVPSLWEAQLQQICFKKDVREQRAGFSHLQAGNSDNSNFSCLNF